MRFRLKKRSYILLISIAVVAGLFFLFYKFGIMKYYDLSNQKDELQRKVDEVNLENERLRAEIDSLKTSDAKIEKVAREKYHMLRPGEKAFKVEEK